MSTLIRDRTPALLALLGLLLAPAAANAADYAVMSTGARLRIERRESEGAVTRLFLAGGGLVEVASQNVSRFESDEYTPPLSSPPAPLVSATPPPPSTGGDLGDIIDIVRSSSARHGLDPDLVYSVIRAESGGNPRAVSPKGAGGLMQLMPATARDLNVADVFDPAQNVDGGVRYLRQLLAQYNNDLVLALAAYNAGPERVAAYRGVPPYRETRHYVSRVINDFNRKKISIRNPQSPIRN